MRPSAVWAAQLVDHIRQVMEKRGRRCFGEGPCNRRRQSGWLMTRCQATVQTSPIAELLIGTKRPFYQSS
jgi:hypothetical protein